MFVYLGALLVLLMDQASKYLVKTHMVQDQAIPILGRYLVLYSHRNQGAAFGILQGKQWLFIGITLIVLVVIGVAERRVSKSKKLIRVALTLLLGGAIGNLIDRVATGKVVDFIYVQVINFPIFNLADSAIVIAVGLLLLDSLIGNNRDQKNK